MKSLLNLTTPKPWWFWEGCMRMALELNEIWKKLYTIMAMRRMSLSHTLFTRLECSVSKASIQHALTESPIVSKLSTASNRLWMMVTQKWRMLSKRPSSRLASIINLPMIMWLRRIFNSRSGTTSQLHMTGILRQWTPWEVFSLMS